MLFVFFYEKVIQYKDNPFLWSSTSQLVTSAVTDFVLRANNSEVKVSNLDDPISIFIPTETPSSDGYPMAINLEIDGTANLQVNLSRNYSALLVFITTNETNILEDVPGSVVLALTELTNASGDNVTIGFPGSYFNGSLVYVPFHRLRISEHIEPVATFMAGDLGGPGEYVIGMRLHNMSDLQGPIQVDVHLLESHCLHWSPTAAVWMPDGCEVRNTEILRCFWCLGKIDNDRVKDVNSTPNSKFIHFDYRFGHPQGCKLSTKK